MLASCRSSYSSPRWARAKASHLRQCLLQADNFRDAVWRFRLAGETRAVLRLLIQSLARYSLALRGRASFRIGVLIEDEALSEVTKVGEEGRRNACRAYLRLRKGGGRRSGKGREGRNGDEMEGGRQGGGERVGHFTQFDG